MKKILFALNHPSLNTWNSEYFHSFERFEFDFGGTFNDEIIETLRSVAKVSEEIIQEWNQLSEDEREETLNRPTFSLFVDEDCVWVDDYFLHEGGYSLEELMKIALEYTELS